MDPEGKYSIAEVLLKDVLNASSPIANLIVQPDDVVSISTQQRLIYIMGEVNRTGAVELVTKDSVSLLQTVAAAGGATKIASISKTTILRLDSNGAYHKVYSIDLKRVMNGKAMDRMLVAGDIVVIPSSTLKVYLQAGSMSALNAGVLILTRF